MFFMVDDQLQVNPKTQGLSRRCGSGDISGMAALGLWLVSGSLVQAKLSDGVVTVEDLQSLTLSRDLALAMAQDLVRAGFWHEHGHSCPRCPPVKQGEFLYHDWFQMRYDKGAAYKTSAEKKKELKDRAIINAVWARDREESGGVPGQSDRARCRYCGRMVKRADRKGEFRWELDHVDPRLAIGAENIVISCRECNRRKGARTPEEAGMRLRPAPGVVSCETVQDDGPSHASGVPECAPRKSVVELPGHESIDAEVEGVAHASAGTACAPPAGVVELPSDTAFDAHIEDDGPSYASGVPECAPRKSVVELPLADASTRGWAQPCPSPQDGKGTVNKKSNALIHLICHKKSTGAAPPVFDTPETGTFPQVNPENGAVENQMCPELSSPARGRDARARKGQGKGNSPGVVQERCQGCGCGCGDGCGDGCGCGQHGGRKGRRRRRGRRGRQGGAIGHGGGCGGASPSSSPSPAPSRQPAPPASLAPPPPAPAPSPVPSPPASPSPSPPASSGGRVVGRAGPAPQVDVPGRWGSPWRSWRGPASDVTETFCDEHGQHWPCPMCQEGEDWI